MSEPCSGSVWEVICGYSPSGSRSLLVRYSHVCESCITSKVSSTASGGALATVTCTVAVDVWYQSLIVYVKLSDPV